MQTALAHSYDILLQRTLIVEYDRDECHGRHHRMAIVVPRPLLHCLPKFDFTLQVVEAGKLEDQATEVTVSSHDVVGLFLLSKLIAIVQRLIFCRLANQGRSHQ